MLHPDFGRDLNEREKFARLLVLVEPAKGARRSAQFAIELAMRLGSALYALVVMARPTPGHPATGWVGRGCPERGARDIKGEERALQYLYEVEERAKDRGVKIILLQERGSKEEAVLSMAERYRVGIIIVDNFAGLYDIIKKSPVPVLIGGQ